MRTPFLFFFVFMCVHNLFSDIQTDISFFATLAPRSEGSEKEKKTLSYIEKRLDEQGVRYTRNALSTVKKGHSFSENIQAIIPGRVSDQYILASPLDGGAFSMAILLELAETFIEFRPSHTIVLEFLGGEKGTSPYHPYGSNWAARNLDKVEKNFVVYLDSETPPEAWKFLLGGDETLTSLWLLKATINEFIEQQIPSRLHSMDVLLTRLNLQKETGRISAWMKQGFSAIEIRGDGFTQHNNQTFQIVEALVSLDKKLIEIPAKEQTIYTLFHPISNFSPLFLSEQPYIILNLFLFVILLFFVLIRIRPIWLNFRRYAQFWWTGPVFFFIVFLFLFLSTLIIEEVCLIFDFPTIWLFAPGLFVLFKIILSFVLSYSFVFITRGVRFPKEPVFYSYTAIIGSIFSLLFFMIVDITLSGFLLWTVLFLLLMLFSKRLFVKTIFLCIASFPVISTLIVFVREPFVSVLSPLIFSRIEGNLISALLVFPLISAATSLNYRRRGQLSSRRNVGAPLVIVTLSFSAIIILGWLLALHPFNSKNPQPVEVIDQINLNNNIRTLLLTSEAPIGSVMLSIEGKEYSLEKIKRRARVRTPLARTPININYSSSVFFGSRTFTLNFSGEASPDRLLVILSSPTPFTLHSSTFPFEMNPSGTEAQFLIGENPPFPLTILATVNAEAKITLSLTGTWSAPENPPSVARKDLAVSVKRIVEKEMILF